MLMSLRLRWHLRNGANFLIDSFRYVLLLLVLVWLIVVAISADEIRLQRQENAPLESRYFHGSVLTRGSDP